MTPSLVGKVGVCIWHQIPDFHKLRLCRALLKEYVLLCPSLPTFLIMMRRGGDRCCDFSLLINWKVKRNWVRGGGQRIEETERLPIQTPTMLRWRKMPVCGQEIWKAVVAGGEPNSKVWVGAANTHWGITLLARSIYNLHAYNLPNAAYVIGYINIFIKL